jgi:very-short-patch-repair endonuclease/predicted nucleic acid-binding Zn ribbon protein
MPDQGICDIVKCNICDMNMSFGRIKRHIFTKHKEEITVDQYVEKYWFTLPLHQYCEVCNKNIVYKYKTCSKECRSNLEHGHKGKLKPKGFMSKEHKEKISKSKIGTVVSKETGDKISNSSTGVSRNKGKTPMLGKKQSDHQKKTISDRMKLYYSDGNSPWTKTNPHTAETIKKIISHRPMNNLEKLVSEILDMYDIPYIHQFYINDKNIIKSYDFKIKNKKILLEIDGDYYHGGPGCEKYFFKIDEVRINDVLKSKIALSHGYNLIRIWESEINSNPQIIIDKLNECI